MQLRRHLSQILRAGISGASGATLVSAAYADVEAQLEPALRESRLTLVSVGKVAAPMATAFLKASRWNTPRGVIAATVGETPDDRLDFFLAGHPVPTNGSVLAGRKALVHASAVAPDGVLLVLLSGGASAALAVPAHGVTLGDKVEATNALLRGGVAIDEINCVRKHLSAIKGGRLAAATPGSVMTLAISDVVGPVEDDVSVIGSGPTVADPTTFADALSVIDHPAVQGAFPPSAREAIVSGARGERPDTPLAGDEALKRSTMRVIGGRVQSMNAATRAARQLGYAVRVVDRPLVGEARLAAAPLLSTAYRLAAGVERPVCVVSSGETTVHVKGAGRGGRNQELALACVDSLGAPTAGPDGDSDIVLASIGTDGIDGPTDAAGAVVDKTTLARSRARGMSDPTSYLDRNDSYAFFDDLGDLVRTGPTDTNVGDLQVVLIGHA